MSWFLKNADFVSVMQELHHTCLLLELQEELLIEDEGHSADLLHFGLSCCVSIDEVCRDGDG